MYGMYRYRVADYDNQLMVHIVLTLNTIIQNVSNVCLVSQNIGRY